MKQYYFIRLSVLMLLTGLFLLSSCKKDLLDQKSTVGLPSAIYWQTEADATSALMGVYNAFRASFDRDYHFDGHGDFVKVYNTGAVTPVPLGVNSPSNYGGSALETYKNLYGIITHANYVIENINLKMLPVAKTEAATRSLESIAGEARLLRGITYLRLISMWGDVPYVGKIVYNPIEVDTLSRMPIRKVKDSILADFTYAFEKLPLKNAVVSRPSKAAALAFRGKMQLFWASWNKFGWPELDKFTPSATEAEAAYRAAASDFKHVIQDYGLDLFRGGDPGQWGTMGSADVLPNYYYMFIPNPGNLNAGGEMLMVLPHGSGLTPVQGDEYQRVFTGPLNGLGQNQVIPRYELANRYQSTITGDFLPPLVQIQPNVAGARTAPNSAINPESYRDRDYRMKATMLWDYEKLMGQGEIDQTSYVNFLYKTFSGKSVINGVEYPNFTDNGTNFSGYQFRKFVRNYGGLARSNGDFNWPVMRLADVFLMYAEATNAVDGPQADAIALVNRVRRRGNLPPLAGSKISSPAAFFSAIEQERIVELVGEGQRAFDLRRWRALERVFGAPYGDGKWFMDTHGNNWERFFQNAPELTYQRCYIYQIPESERTRNSNLTQNIPWR
jgi:hypothetical protein